MGNPQERSLAWLAGIVDGEGSVSFQVYTLPDGRIRVTPFMCVTNSDEGILQEAKAVLDDILDGTNFGKARLCGRSTGGPNAVVKSEANCRTIRVDGVASGYVLEQIWPYLHSVKRRNAKAVMMFLESRQRGLLLRDAAGRINRVGYRQSEIDLVVSTRKAKTAKSSEAIRSAPNVVDG